MNSPSIEEQILSQVDPSIRPLVKDLREAGLDTDWSCSGEEGHMVTRTTIEIRCNNIYREELRVIREVLKKLDIKDYWLSLMFSGGSMDTHGGESVWLLQLPGRYDFLSLPVAYSAKYQTPLDELDDLEKIQKAFRDEQLDNIHAVREGRPMDNAAYLDLVNWVAFHLPRVTP